MKTSLQFSALALLLTASIGCEEPALPTSKPAAPAIAEAPPEEPPMVAGAPGKELPETEVPVTDIPRKFIATDPVQGRRSRREAREGSNIGGLGTTIAGGMFAKHQMMIHAIDQSLALYVPQHNFEFPKTQDEFMKDVVELALNGQPLPTLQDDHEYCYVPSQPEEGLQIRLKPGSPKSKVPAGTTPEEAIKMLAGDEAEGGEAAAGEAAPVGETPAQPAAADAPAGAAAAPEPESGRDEAGNPLDLRERAAGIGGPALDVE
jgi:hypothetical protein